MANCILSNKSHKSKNEKLEPGTYRVTINPELRLSIVPATIQKITVEIYVSGLPVGTTEASLLQNLYYLLDWSQSYRDFEVSIERVEPGA